MSEEDCVIINTLNLIGKKWTVFILSELFTAKRGLLFSSLLHQVRGKCGEKISSRVLTDSLLILEKNEIIERTIIQERPLRVEYALTEKGFDLDVVFGALKGWGTKWGDIKFKKCQSFTCMHNAVQIMDINKAKQSLYSSEKK